MNLSRSCFLTLLLLPMFSTTTAFAEEAVPTISVNGAGEVAVIPDSAVLVFGAEVRAAEAAQAQQRVGRIMNEAVRALRALGMAERSMTTAGLSLAPVYVEDAGQERHEPRLVGYEAGSRLEVRIDDIERIGAVVDAAVAAGANRIEHMALTLRDDKPQRREALYRAVLDARAKADAIAAAMGVRIESIMEVNEQGVGIIEPRLRAAPMALSAETATPVLPGQVRVEASVTARYRIAPSVKASE